MSSIEIRTVADVKRAFAIPGILVFTDRNDVLADRLMREPSRMETWMKPRTVDKVRSADVILLQEGRQGYVNLPKASDLEADGTNTFTIVVRRKDDRSERRITYRLELAGTPGADQPSRLPENHPPISAETVAEEQAAREAHAAQLEAEQKAYGDELKRISLLPPPAADPRYACLMANMRDAIKGALRAGLSYNTDVEAYVRDHLAEPDFAVMTRLPDIVVQADGRVPTGHLEQTRAEHELGSAKRGTWRLLISTWPGQTHRAATLLVSTGSGKRASNFEGSIADRGEQSILLRVQQSEIYYLRNEVEAEAKVDKNSEAFRRRNFRIGQQFRNLSMGGKLYSSASITEVDEERKSVKLTMKRRGSRSTYHVTLSAGDLDRLAPQEPAPGEQAAEGALL